MYFSNSAYYKYSILGSGIQYYGQYFVFKTAVESFLTISVITFIVPSRNMLRNNKNEQYHMLPT